MKKIIFVIILFSFSELIQAQNLIENVQIYRNFDDNSSFAGFGQFYECQYNLIDIKDIIFAWNGGYIKTKENDGSVTLTLNGSGKLLFVQRSTNKTIVTQFCSFNYGKKEGNSTLTIVGGKDYKIAYNNGKPYNPKNSDNAGNANDDNILGLAATGLAVYGITELIKSFSGSSNSNQSKAQETTTKLNNSTQSYSGSSSSKSSEPTKCKVCNGRGVCLDCNGRGSIQCWLCDGKGVTSGSLFNPGDKICSECDGKGSKKCNNCNGSGSCYKCRGKGVIY